MIPLKHKKAKAEETRTGIYEITQRYSSSDGTWKDVGRKELSREDLEERCHSGMSTEEFGAELDAVREKFLSWRTPGTVITIAGTTILVGGAIYLVVTRDSAVYPIIVGGSGLSAVGAWVRSWELGWKPGDLVKKAYNALAKIS